MGRWLYRLRWPIIGLWLLFVLACSPFLPSLMTVFKNTSFTDDHADSAKAEKYLDQNLEYNPSNKFIIIYTSKQLLATNPLFLKKLKQSLEGLKTFPIKSRVIYPDTNNKHVSKNKHSAYVVVMFHSKTPFNEALLKRFKQRIKVPKNMSLQLGGKPVFEESITQQTQKDLFKADFIAAPMAIITLLLVFGTVVAAMLPVVLGGIGAISILTLLYGLGHFVTLSIFTINIALLLGLCLSLDYSLFFISRFRDELNKNPVIEEAIAITQSTAGKAIFFSGLAVFASLSALLLFPVNILFSVGVGGLTAVLIAMLLSITLLPAILSVLHERINALPVRSLTKNNNQYASKWGWLAQNVVKHRVFFFFSTMVFLLALGFPLFSAKFGIFDLRILPQHSEARNFFDRYIEQFKEPELTPINMLVRMQPGKTLSNSNLSKLYNLATKIEDNPKVAEVDSIVTTTPRLTEAQYYHLYQSPKQLDQNLKSLLITTTGTHFTVLSIISKKPSNALETKQLINDLHSLTVPKKLRLQLTGTPVSNQDVLDTIWRILPYALLWTILFSYLILLLLLRSLFLPFKAILMNILSLSACYGALVLIFQDGYLHHLLHFDPQGMLDISLVVIIFCALFGFSMDYEVFLLSRMKEAYDISGDNDQSIVTGMEKSGRIITSAALIVIVLCGAFLVADIVMVKAFGLGIAVAVFVDAFIIRSLLVPATMALVKSWNWYLPAWMDKILPK
jgi:RND superfamily putative drug exporter